MKFWMRIAAPFTLVMSFAVGAQAQMWGTGMYGGMQSCPYNYGAAAGSSSYLDEIKEAQANIREAEKQLRAKKSEKKRIEKNMEKSRKDVEEVVSEDFSEFVFDHMENNRTCRSYKGHRSNLGQTDDGGNVSGEQGGVAIVTPQTNGDIPNSVDVRAFTIKEWDVLCDENKAGSVGALVCDGARFRQPEKGRATAQDCKRGLSDYKKGYAQSNKLQREIESLENAIRNSKRDRKSVV